MARAALFLLTQYTVHAVISKEVFYERQPSVTKTPRTLVVFDDAEIQKTHAGFFKSLESRGHTVTYHQVDAQLNSPLSQYDELVYDNIVLFTPKMDKFPLKLPMKKKLKNTMEQMANARNAESTKRLALKHLLDYIDLGGNVIIGTTNTVGQDVRKLANECGVDFDMPESRVVDHVTKHAKDTGDHSLVHAGAIRADNRPVTADVDGSKVLFRGIGHTVGRDSLAFSILHGSPTAYSWGSEGMLSTHDDTHLVSATQTRNGARVLFMGSLEMCSDEFYALSAENAKFCTEVSKWTFREKSVLKWTNLTSHKVGEEHIGTPYMYRMKDDVVFKIDIEEFDGEWKPFQAKDVQVELVMLDPYVRIFLDPPTTGSTFTKTFKTPDRYGIFKWKLVYIRRGYNQIHVEHLAPLRNFKHNDYDRFLWVASPYYSVCLITPFSVLLVSFLFLYHREKKADNALTDFDH